MIALKNHVSSLAAILVIVFLGCTPQSTSPTEVPAKQEATKPFAEAADKPAWQQDWEKMVEDAKREGSIVLYNSIGTNEIAALRMGFGNAYGISIESVTGRGAEVREKLFAERKAGLFLADVSLVGTTTTILDMKGAGVLVPLKPLLVLPEVVDPKVWYGGSPMYGDRESIYALLWSYYPDASTVVNTELVKPGEMTSNRDLLNTKWKKKIVLNDPTLSGKGQKWFQMVSRSLGIEFMREFAKQEPEISRDQRLQIEWVARGKYSILVGADPSGVAEFLSVGAPLKQVLAPDALYASTANPIAVPSKGPHPNAAKVFLNWFLTKEGQTIASKAFLVQSSRLDVPTNHLDPVAVRQPGLIYENSVNEDQMVASREAAQQAATIFGLGR
ncbi:MAG: extracellular solute-binding protein [Chloroflexi bacterium]|nr:extracellular solute-binding protein [Chloroflexota bacterium]